MMGKFNEMFPIQAVINLDSRPDRLKICLEQEFPKLRLTTVARFPGIVPLQIEDKHFRGMVGCLFSHRALIEFAIEQKSNLFVFEDEKFHELFLPFVV